jgi:hypothetical protein
MNDHNRTVIYKLSLDFGTYIPIVVSYRCENPYLRHTKTWVLDGWYTYVVLPHGPIK